METNDKKKVNGKLIAIMATMGVSAGFVGFYCGYKISYRTGYAQGFCNAAGASFEATLLWLANSVPEAYKAVTEWMAANPDKMISTQEMVQKVMSAN